jgi:hypothetical protein
MILYQDSLIVLDYNPVTDVLVVQWPDFQKFSLAQIEDSFRLLVENIKRYDIKKLLIDSGATHTDANNKDYLALIYQLGKNFNTTRLEKIARVVTKNPVWEGQLSGSTEKLQSDYQSDIEYLNFDDKEAALAWLEA